MNDHITPRTPGRNAARFNRRTTAVISTAFVAVLAFTVASNGAIIPLTGGDSGEGYAPRLPVYAYDTSNAGDHTSTTDTRTVQGIVFQPYDQAGFIAPSAAGDFSTTMSNAFNWTDATLSIGASANDTQLSKILGDGLYNATPSAALTLKNLTPNQLYQVDLFVWSSDHNRYPTYTFTNGTTTVSDTFVFTGTPLDVREALTADALGQITVTILEDHTTETSYAGGPTLSGFSVTVPEPASLGLLVAGSVLMLRRKRSCVTAS